MTFKAMSPNLEPATKICHREARAQLGCALILVRRATVFSRRLKFMRRFIFLAGIAVTMLASAFAGAQAQQPALVQVGVLECRGGASIGFIVGSVTHLGCVLRVDGRPE